MSHTNVKKICQALPTCLSRKEHAHATSVKVSQVKIYLL